MSTTQILKLKLLKILRVKRVKNTLLAFVNQEDCLCQNCYGKTLTMMTQQNVSVFP